MSRGDGGAAFKVGDRVEVIAVHEGDEDYFSLGATGTVAKIDRDGDYWIDFDSGAKTYGFGQATWCANPSQLAARGAK